jgi:OOP family OmpA-OmpF porin
VGRATPAFAALAFAATVSACTAAVAQESGPYLGGSLGQSSFTEWCDTGGAPITLTACKDTDTAWKLLGGYRFNRYLAVEASYIDWGEVTASAVSGGQAVEVAAEQKSYGVAGVGSLRLGPRFEVFGKLGFVHTDQQTKRITPNPSTVEREETELHYGLGLKYAFTRNWAARAEWENTEKLKVEMFSVGVESRFDL